MRIGTQQKYNNQDRYVNEFILHRTWTTVFSLVCYLKHLDTNYFFLYLLSLIMCERVEKIIVRRLCFMHQSIFRPIYIFNNDASFFDFRAQKFPLIVFNSASTSPAFWCSKIRKTTSRRRLQRLGKSVVFSACYADFCCCSKSVIITTLTMFFSNGCSGLFYVHVHSY